MDKEGEKEDMPAITKPVESMDITCVSKKELERITEIINNPSKPSQYVKNAFKNYQNKRNKNND